MNKDWIATEHTRLHLAEEWPNSAYKQATLAAIRSTLASLERNQEFTDGLSVCNICVSRNRMALVLQLLTPVESGLHRRIWAA